MYDGKNVLTDRERVAFKLADFGRGHFTPLPRDLGEHNNRPTSVRPLEHFPRTTYGKPQRAPPSEPRHPLQAEN